MNETVRRITVSGPTEVKCLYGPIRHSPFCLRHSIVPGLFVVGVMVAAGGCFDAMFLLNQTASLGGSTAGERGTVSMLFINNTPQRAVFTFGTYDQTDQDSQPDFAQFGPNDYDMTLDGDAESDIFSLSCARAFSIGSARMLELIEDNLHNAAVIDEALVEGVEFIDVPSEDDPDSEDEGFVDAGSAPAFEALLGVDFPCHSLLIIRFERNDQGPDPFRIDFELIPSESTR